MCEILRRGPFGHCFEFDRVDRDAAMSDSEPQKLDLSLYELAFLRAEVELLVSEP